jgi:nucleoside-diphosphate-sugar epimerase
LKILVTGGTGFIGSHLVETLLRREGMEVRCLVRRKSDLRWLKDLPVEFFYGDCNDPESLKGAVKDVDQVFHVAGLTRAVDEETLFRVNALGTENLIHACLEHNPRVQKLLYLSSQAAAGPCQNGGKKKESDPCQPVSSYGRSKRRGEELALDHADRLPIVILRPSAVYGPREKDIFTYVKLLSRRIMPCFSAPDQCISLCYVQDIVRAMIQASEKETAGGDIFFVSDGHDYRTEEIGEAFARALEVSPVRIPIPTWLISGIAFFSDHWSRWSGKPALISRGKVEEMVQKHWRCDISKARTLLGFEPGVSLEEGAVLTVEWYRKENWL